MWSECYISHQINYYQNKWGENTEYVFLMTYQVQGSPWYCSDSHTFAMWITIAPIPCLEVSKNQISHDLLSKLGSQNLLTENIGTLLSTIIHANYKHPPIRQVKAKQAKRICKNHPKTSVSASFGQCSPVLLISLYFKEKLEFIL